MAYSSNKAMADGGGGVSFNYKPPAKTNTYKAPVSKAKANRDTQTRYEQQQLAAQQAAAAARAQADAIARFQREEAARLEREAAIAAAAAAEAERKRKALELKNWNASTEDRFSRGNMPVTSAKEKKTFGDVLNGLTKGWVTDVANNFVSNKLPQQARNLPTAKVDDRFTRIDDGLPETSFWKQAAKAVADYTTGHTNGAANSFASNVIPQQARNLPRPKIEDRFTRDTLTSNDKGPIQKREEDLTFWERVGMTPGAIPQQARGLQYPEVTDRFTRDTLTSNDKGPINKEPGFWDKAAYAVGNTIMAGTNKFLAAQDPEFLAEQGYVVPPPKPPDGQLNYQSYSKFMQPKGPFMPGESQVGPLQDRFTGEDKLSYQSHLPSYWETATPDKLNFYRYPNGGEAAAEAEAAYQTFAKKYKDQYEQKLLEQSPDLNKQAHAGLNDDSFGGAIGMYNDAKLAAGEDFDPKTAFGQRLIKELAGNKEPSYTDTWALMDADIKQKTNASNELTAAYKALLAAKSAVPDMSDLTGANGKVVKNPRDMFTSVVINGRTYWVPRENLSFASYYPWETSITDYRPPERWTDAGHQWKEAKDYGWQPEVGSNEAEAAAPAVGDGGYGGYGGYGYGSGGSYWSPSGYYDNQFTKDRYGSFQNLAKWVI